MFISKFRVAVGEVDRILTSHLPSISNGFEQKQSRGYGQGIFEMWQHLPSLPDSEASSLIFNSVIRFLRQIETTPDK